MCLQLIFSHVGYKFMYAWARSYQCASNTNTYILPSPFCLYRKLSLIVRSYSNNLSLIQALIGPSHDHVKPQHRTEIGSIILRILDNRLAWRLWLHVCSSCMMRQRFFYLYTCSSLWLLDSCSSQQKSMILSRWFFEVCLHSSICVSVFIKMLNFAQNCSNALICTYIYGIVCTNTGS